MVLVVALVVGFSGRVVTADGSGSQQRPRHFLWPGLSIRTHDAFVQLDALTEVNSFNRGEQSFFFLFTLVVNTT